MSNLIESIKNKNIGKIALRTKKWISEALIELMKTKDYNNITIKEIVVKADVSRQSFYRHFNTKEDVIGYYVETNIVTDFESRFAVLKSPDLEEILLLYFVFWQDKIETFEVMMSSNYSIHLMENYEKLLRHHLTSSLYSIINELDISNDAEIDIVVSFIIGGLYNVKRHWDKSVSIYSPNKIAKTVSKLIKGTLYEE